MADNRKALGMLNGRFSLVFAKKLARYSAPKERKLGRIRQGAKVSRSYTRSRRILAAIEVVEKRKALGLNARQPICECGRCKACRFREARRRRKTLRDGIYYWKQEPAQSSHLFEEELAAVTRTVRSRF